MLRDLVDVGVAACPCTRPTSRTTAFAFIVPKVMICATFSRPYFRVTYSMTSPRRALAEVDVDVGQRLMRSGFRKRSKMQVVLDRVDVGDAQAVGHEAAGGRAAARADRECRCSRA